MSNQIDIYEAGITIMIDVDNEMYLVNMTRDNYEAIAILVRNAVEDVIVTNKTVDDLYNFVGLGGTSDGQVH